MLSAVSFSRKFNLLCRSSNHQPYFRLYRKPKNYVDSEDSPVKKSGSDSFGKKIPVAVTKSMHKLTPKYEENEQTNENRIPSSVFLKELSKFSPKSVNYARDDSVAEQLKSESSIKLLNLQKKEPPRQQTVVNKIFITNDYMNLSYIGQKNGIQDTKNVVGTTDATTGNVHQLEFSKNYQANSVNTMKSTDYTKSEKNQTVIEKYVFYYLKLANYICPCWRWFHLDGNQRIIRTINF